MASNSGWTTGLPSGNSLVANTDEEFRSLKSFQEAWWEQEHYATDGSANSAGVHKQGSARAFVQAAAPTTEVVQPAGQLWVDTDDDGLYYHDGSSWVLMTNAITLGSAQSWTGVQQFMAGSLNSTGGQLAPARVQVHFAEENVTSGASAIADLQFTAQSFGLSQQCGVGPRTGSITGIQAVFNANITAGSIVIQPFIVDGGNVASGWTVGMDASSTSNPNGGAGHVVTATANESTYTFASGTLIGCYVEGDGSLSPSGTGDITELVIEITLDE